MTINHPDKPRRQNLYAHADLRRRGPGNPIEAACSTRPRSHRVNR